MNRRKNNILSLGQGLFAKLPLEFREHVCEQCGWSKPTFYRKMSRVSDEGKSPKAVFSNAEIEMISKVWREMLKDVDTAFSEILKQ